MTLAKIRLGCGECDRTDFDGIDQVPKDWTDISEFQSHEESLREVDINDHSQSPFEWYTHLGTCPDCQAQEEQ
jgi:hypothetical protein